MTDKQVLNELWINSFKNQIDGYQFGDPCRNKNFNPIVVSFKKEDGTLNRELIVNSVSYTFTDEQKKLLLDTSE